MNEENDVNELAYDMNEDCDALMESECGEINSNASDMDANEEGSKGESDDSDGNFGRWDHNEVPIERKQPVRFNIDD